MGVWHEMERSKVIPFEKGDCVTARYQLQDDGYVEVYNSQLLDSGEETKIFGSARCS